jgi:hypothetical protein
LIPPNNNASDKSVARVIYLESPLSLDDHEAEGGL